MGSLRERESVVVTGLCALLVADKPPPSINSRPSWWGGYGGQLACCPRTARSHVSSVLPAAFSWQVPQMLARTRVFSSKYIPLLTKLPNGGVKYNTIWAPALANFVQFCFGVTYTEKVCGKIWASQTLYCRRGKGRLNPSRDKNRKWRQALQAEVGHCF